MLLPYLILYYNGQFLYMPFHYFVYSDVIQGEKTIAIFLQKKGRETKLRMAEPFLASPSEYRNFEQYKNGQTLIFVYREKN